ncbi:MAG: efflux RND transporter permease subunit, partial [Gemmatimonadetes bacterium]
MSLPSLATRRPVAVAMFFLGVVLLGAISFVRLPIDLLPDVSFPRLVVYTAYPDVAPEQVERLITEPVEAVVAAVPGVERVSSVTRDGVSLVTLRFAWGTDMDFALLNTRERLDGLRGTLPETAERPSILRVDPDAEAVMVLSVSGGADLWETRDIAETVFRRRLEQLDGVAQAQVAGGLDREIHVEVDPLRLQTYGLTLADVATALAQANYSAPGGTVLRGRYRFPLRTLGEFRSVEEIGDVVVARRAQGDTLSEDGGPVFRLVRVRDLATVEDGFKDRETITRYGGHESVGLLVFKEAGANTVAVSQEVERTLAQLREEYPAFTLDVASTQADFIADSISNVVQALVFGGLLAFLVLFLFLRDPRYPVAIALAIPISVVGTFALMDLAGVSLNIMSLGGLALGVGMLVDNSIVVLENIFRHREQGADAWTAAARGAEEVQGAITASTLTTVSVFLPIVYVEGVAGELFGDLSLAVTFSLLASLLVAVTLLPTTAARFGDGRRAPVPSTGARERPRGFFARARWLVGGLVSLPFRLLAFLGALLGALLLFWGRGFARVLGALFGPLIDAFERLFERFAARYHGALEWSLDHPGRVLAASTVALALTLVSAVTLDRDLLPEVDQGAFDVHLALAEGTALPVTTAEAERIERTLLADPDVDAVFTRVGRDVRAYAEGEDVAGLNTATLQVRLQPHAHTHEVIERLRPLAATVQGTLTFETGQATALGQVLGGSDADVSVRIRTEDLRRGLERADLVAARLAALPMLGNVRVGMDRGQPEVQVQIDARATARHGIDTRVVAEELDRAMRGTVATEFLDFDRKIPVVVRFPDSLRYAEATLSTMYVRDIPLRELIRVRDVLAPSEVFREDQARTVTVLADVTSGGLDQAIGAIERALADLPASRTLSMDVGGENEEMRRSFRDLAFAFGLALLLVYMILAAQFESLVHPFTILIAVPLALVGAVLALEFTGEGLNTMSLIGVVILVGIVVNDAIVKVDFINQARARGAALREAILEAGRVRLRPIVMTTVTTVLGLFPMALGLGRGADLRAPLAIAVIGGLSVATALTLIVVPVVYAQLDRLRGGEGSESPGGGPEGPAEWGPTGAG